MRLETINVLCESFPHWHLHEVQGAGHMGPLTHATPINAQIESFLAT